MNKWASHKYCKLEYWVFNRLSIVFCCGLKLKKVKCKSNLKWLKHLQHFGNFLSQSKWYSAVANGRLKLKWNRHFQTQVDERKLYGQVILWYMYFLGLSFTYNWCGSQPISFISCIFALILFSLRKARKCFSGLHLLTHQHQRIIPYIFFQQYSITRHIILSFHFNLFKSTITSSKLWFIPYNSLSPVLSPQRDNAPFCFYFVSFQCSGT